MRKHNGMRPQDVAILLKITARKNQFWQLLDLSNSLKISLSEISESLNRSQVAGLLDQRKRKVNRQSLLEFLEHGIRYVFPVIPGTLVRGIPTAHSLPEFRKKFVSDIDYVWPYAQGHTIGLSIDPLYPKLPDSVEEDPEYYKLLCLTDMIRVGKTREVKYAVIELKKIILNEPSYQHS